MLYKCNLQETGLQRKGWEGSEKISECNLHLVGEKNKEVTILHFKLYMKKCVISTNFVILFMLKIH